MTQYSVFDNGKPASVKGFPSFHPSWKTNTFNTFEEAQEYTRKWLGAYGEGVVLSCDTPWDYSGYGDMIEIRKV